ncbi:MAG TPA: PAS sensor protein, partial [Trichocoleus sp.]
GYTLIRKIRALPPQFGGETPAAALTAYVRGNDQQQALAAGFQEHIAKPVEPLLLVRLIAQLAHSKNP